MSDSKQSAANAKAKAFKPRAGIVRKSKAERDAHAKQEADKAAARAAAAAQAAGKPTQTTKPGAAKKRESQKDNRDSSQGTLGGVFGAGTGLRQGRTRSALGGGYSEVLEGQEAAKPSDGPTLQGQDGGPSSQRKVGGGENAETSAGTKRNIISRPAQGGTQIESDDEPDEDRRDIERIQISSDEEQIEEGETLDTIKGKGREISEGRRVKQSLGLRPVRAPRVLAEDQEAQVEKREDKKTSRSSRMVAEDTDGRDDTERMEIDDEHIGEMAQIKQDMPSSPELSKRVKPGRKVGARTKDGKLATETVEERAERLRLNEDIEKLRDEFVTPRTIKIDDEMDQEGEPKKPNGKLFLFQFPPLVPFLVDQAAIPAGGLHKKSHVSEDGQHIKSDPDAPAAVADGTTEGETGPASSLPKTQLEGLLTANEPNRLPSGRVGKLRVHRSGKVTLDWGGTDMEVRHGTEVDFLQDAVLVETPGQPNDGEEKSQDTHMGTTYALGQVQKKMIVIPDWQKLYD